MFYLHERSFTADFMPSALLPPPPAHPLKNPSAHYKKPLFAPFSLIQVFLLTPSPYHLCEENAQIPLYTGCLLSTPISLLHLEALISHFASSSLTNLSLLTSSKTTFILSFTSLAHVNPYILFLIYPPSLIMNHC